MKIKDKVIVITGASSGIGKELAFQLAKKGARVVLAARNVQALEEIAGQIEKEGGVALAVPADISQRFHVARLMQRTDIEFGRLDVLINNAGISHRPGIITEIEESDFRSTMETNFMGSVYGVWAAVPLMEKHGGGLIVFVTSAIGKRGVPRSAGYCASKFAVEGLAESIRPELAPKNIRVLTVCPPGVDTPFFEKNYRQDVRRYRLHPVQKIAHLIVKAVEKEKRGVLLTLDSKALYWANVFFPRLLDWVLAKVKRS
ncbi:MAG: SDR family NAD(P)-dependent oxidoreductase [Elusimicrobia bacterium]|nr:SDR family NAD(P)-dependent oxidoreductase [Candidatus Obscuribacterium magneticum]